MRSTTLNQMYICAVFHHLWHVDLYNRIDIHGHYAYERRGRTKKISFRSACLQFEDSGIQEANSQQISLNKNFKK